MGGDWNLALGAAVCVELIHKSSVIRDDIVDGDDMRSGQPALHTVFGVEKAIAVSDVLWTLGLRQISSVSEAGARRDKLQVCIDALYEMALGQLEDVAPSQSMMSTRDRLLVEERKTGVLSELSCRLGAILGGGNDREIEMLAQYGRLLGTAFQVLNDVRNLRGDETDRVVASDLRNRRDTLLSAYARETAADSDVRRRLAALRSESGAVPGVEIETLHSAIIESGATAFGEETAIMLMEKARSCLGPLRESLSKEILESLTKDALLTYAF